MLARVISLTLLLLVATLSVVYAADAVAAVAKEAPIVPSQVAPAGMKVDPNHPLSCEIFRSFKQRGKVSPLKSSDKNFYTAPGTSTCGVPVTNDMPVACVNQGW